VIEGRKTEASYDPRDAEQAQRERIKPLLPGKAGDPGRSSTDNRRFVEAVLWMVRTGSSWRDLPEAIGCWN
jgi:transposase